MHTVCSSCYATLRLPDSAIGKTARCPKCKTLLAINDPSQPIEVAPTIATAIGIQPEQIGGQWMAVGPEYSNKRKLVNWSVIVMATALLIACPCSGLLGWRTFFHRSPGQRVLDQIGERVEHLQEEDKAKNADDDEAGRVVDTLAGQEDAVMKHKWWRRELTAAELDKIVDFIIDTNSGYLVIVEDDLRTTRIDSVGTDIIDRLPYGRDSRDIVGAKSDWFSIKIGGAKRMGRHETLNHVLAALDRVELVIGPGRGPKARSPLKQREGPGILDQWKNAPRDLPNGRRGALPARPAAKDH